MVPNKGASIVAGCGTLAGLLAYFDVPLLRRIRIPGPVIEFIKRLYDIIFPQQQHRRMGYDRMV